MRGNDDGSFQSPTVIGQGSYHSNLLAADLNRDGKTDLIGYGAYGTTALDVLLGNGDGTFQAPVGLAVAETPSSVGATDINLDGKLDLVVLLRSHVQIGV